MGKPKILVEITEINRFVHYKKCAVNDDGKISIFSKGGRGLENPDSPKDYFEQKGFLGLGKKKYARYNRSSNKFMTIADDKLLPISRELTQRNMNNDAYEATFGNKKTSFINYVIVAGIAFIALMQILPYLR